VVELIAFTEATAHPWCGWSAGREQLADGRLPALAPARPVPQRAYYLLRRARAGQPAVAVFTDWLLRQTGRPPGQE
jgi:DNA-binding transcriptional LysR family regulator